MKYCYPVLLFIFLSARFPAQVYHPVLDSGKTWSSVEGAYGWPSVYISHEDSIGSDTVISNVTYKKILRADDSAGLQWYTAGFAREDSLRRVYFRYTSNASDRLIYDFGITTGDTVGIYADIFTPDTMIVDSIGSITLLNSETRNAWYLHDIYYTWDIDIWIEGIGSVKGFFNPGFTGVDAIKDLLCFHENDTLKFMNTNPPYTGCYINNTGIADAGDRLVFSVQPNPAAGQFSVLSTRKITSIVLFGVTGDIVYSKNIYPEANRLDIAEATSFAKGIYFIKVTDAVGNTAVQKIVLE